MTKEERREYKRKWIKTNPDKVKKYGIHRYNTSSKNFMNAIFLQAKARAEQYKMEFNLDIEYLKELYGKQGGKCAISGMEFVFDYDERYYKRPHCPSLDRIDSKKGYIKGNLRFTTSHVNTALNQYGEDALIELAKAVLINKGYVITSA